MRFQFIGDFNLNTETGIRKGQTKANGDDYISLNISVVDRKNNRGRCELFGMKSSVIKTMNTEKEKIDINWKDRNDPDVIKSVANYKKNTIRIDGKYHEFISGFDACNFILDNVEVLENKRVIVTGQVQKDIYNGNFKDRFTISNLYVLDENDQRKNGLNLFAEVFWDKEGLDISDFKSEKRIYLNGYTFEYIKDEGENRYVPIQLVLDCSKLDFENEHHMNLLQTKLIEMGLTYKEGKLTNVLKAKSIAAAEFVASVLNGAEEVEFSIDDCTDKQRMYITMGINTLDDFRPKGNLYGNWKTEYKILRPDITGKYKDGMIYLDIKPSEFEDQIYVPMADEKIEDLPFEESMNPPEPVDITEEEEDLFG